MLLSYVILDFYLFYDGAVDMQIWALLTRGECRFSDTQLTVKACRPLGRCHLPLEKGVALYLKSCEFIPFTQEWFVPSFNEIGPVALEKKTFQFRQSIFAIPLLSPFRKGRSPSFEQS